MKQLIKQLIPDSIIRNFRRNKDLKTFEAWKKNGETLPVPHIVKQLKIDEFLKKTEYKILVETGTFMGDMIEAQRTNFDLLYSIELNEKLHKMAVEKFKKFNHIHLLQGDSATKLAEITTLLEQPAIFWLDGHYSGSGTSRGIKDCPIWEELEAIYNSELNHCILIDDSRLFGTDPAYPQKEELNKYILEKRPNSSITIENDIICIITR